MSLKEETLLHCGFKPQDTQILKEISDKSDGDLDAVITDFARRFMIYSSVLLVFFSLLVLLFLLFPKLYLPLLALGLIITLTILKLLSRPVIACKCWLYCSRQWR